MFETDIYSNKSMMTAPAPQKYSRSHGKKSWSMWKFQQTIAVFPQEEGVMECTDWERVYSVWPWTLAMKHGTVTGSATGWWQNSHPLLGIPYTEQAWAKLFKASLAPQSNKAPCNSIPPLAMSLQPHLQAHSFECNSRADMEEAKPNMKGGWRAERSKQRPSLPLEDEWVVLWD